MNIVDRFFLWFFLLPKQLYVKAGIDIKQLQAILTAKLTMDNRRPASLMGNRRGKSNKQELNGSSLKTMLGALLMGLIMLYTFGIGVDTLTKLTFFCTMFIFMLCLTLITDFTSVLIDVRDNLIILPKPISDRTFLAARLLHITIRTSMVVLPLSLPGCVTVALVESPVVILPFLFMVLMMTLFSIFLINAIYVLILKITTPEKFKSIINAIQIVFVILLMAAYQLLPRLLYSDNMLINNIANLSWIRFYPAYWFSEGCMFLSGLSSHPEALISLVLSIVVPLVSIWSVVRFFAPSFNQKLAMISGGVTEKSTKAVSKHPGVIKWGVKKWYERIGSLITKPGTEYAGYIFAWKMMGRSRDFKMKVLPQLGYLVVFGALFFIQGHAIKNAMLLLIYFSSMALTAAIYQLPYSDKHKAAWLFHITPVVTPGTLINGAVKAILIMYYLPISVVLLVVGGILQGPAALPSLLLGCLNILVITLLFTYMTLRKLPFSESQDGTAGGTTFIRTMLMLVPPALLGVFHWLISDMTWVILLLLLIVSVVPWLIFDEIKKMDWNRLK
jgi:ABC-2 type transport system permease protein